MRERILTTEEVRASGHYDDMVELSAIFHHDIVEEDGVWRWKQNKLSRYLSYRISLNDVWLAYHHRNGGFTVEEMMKFYMEIGYSLCGFSEVFGQKEASDLGLKPHKKPVGDSDDYLETPIEWVIQEHKGKFLKI